MTTPKQIKKKKVSKKLKRSWRKHANVQDVEEFLEEKRFEERISVVPLEDVPNEALFQIDTKSSSSESPRSIKEKRKLLTNKPLKCFSALTSYSKVPDPISKRNRVRTKEERKNKLVKEKEERTSFAGVIKAKVLLAMKDRQICELHKKDLAKRGEFVKDLWANKDDIKSQMEQDEWASTDTKLNNLRGIGVINKSTKHLKKNKNNLPAIEPPHPGTSYNPSFEDHQNLLTTIAEKEMNLIKQEEHLKRCTTGMFEKISATARDQLWMVEMSEGLPSTRGATNEDENDTENNEEYKSINPPIKNKKKTAKQRRKQKEQIDLQKGKLALKREKKKITDIHKIKSLNEQIKKIEERQKLLRDKRQEKLIIKKGNTKQLNANKYEEPDLEFQMGHEISGNLKNLKAEGNLLVDRFKSMQKRNIVAPTQRHKKSKVKVKKYVKPGHKEDDWKKTVARKFN